ncbi:MAG: hypothetical protein ABI459_08340, partial [Deltaproteobacteria bacterium]
GHVAHGRCAAASQGNSRFRPAARASLSAVIRTRPDRAGSPRVSPTHDAARLLEPLGMLNIRFGLGRGTDIAPTRTSL